MVFWMGIKAKVERVQGGKEVIRDCPSCGRRARFCECVRKETLTAFSVIELLDDEETLFRCSECGDLFQLRDGKSEEEKEGEAQRVAEEQAQRVREEKALQAKRIEARLAEMKRKLGK